MVQLSHLGGILKLVVQFHFLEMKNKIESGNDGQGV